MGVIAGTTKIRIKCTIEIEALTIIPSMAVIFEIKPCYRLQGNLIKPKVSGVVLG